MPRAKETITIDRFVKGGEKGESGRERGKGEEKEKMKGKGRGGKGRGGGGTYLGSGVAHWFLLSL